MNAGWLIFAALFWLAAWALNEWLVRLKPLQPPWSRAINLAVPVIFGVTILVLWEGARARLRRAADPAAGAVDDLGAPHRIAADPLGRFPADLPQGGADRLCAGLRLGLRRRHPDRPLALPAARPAAARQFRLGPAHRRHRADHGDVVRLRLAVQGGGRRRHDLLPDAGEHGAGPRRRLGASSAT